MLNVSKKSLNLIRLWLEPQSPQSDLQLRGVHKPASLGVKQIERHPELLNMAGLQTLRLARLELGFPQFLLH